jgi:hypothetical protein
MRWASYGFETLDGMEFLQPSSPHSITSTPPARAPTPSSYTPWHLAARLLISPSLLEGERKQVTVDPDVMEERG